MSKVTAADKLIARGFDYSIDGNNGSFDPYYDDADVLKQLEINPTLKAGELSKLTKLPSHRVIAAMMRLKTAGKFPVKPPAGIVVNFLAWEIIESEPLAVEEPLTVITLWQPWATLLIKGVKIHETRSWYTSHRGKILIHAAKRKINWCEIQLNLLEEIYPDITEWEYPLGAIVGEMELVDCRQCGAVRVPVSESDRLTGDWSDGRFAWEMRNVKPLLIPNVKGKQGLWKYEPSTIKDVLGELEDTSTTKEQIDLLTTDPPRQVEANGQLSLFFDDSDEPPDPDDYPNNYEEVYEQWALKFPELNAAINRKKSQGIKNSHCEIGDYIQLKSDPRRIGQITGLKSGGLYKIRFADGFTTDLKADQFEDRPFSKENSGIVLGESFFKVGEYVTASSPGFEGKIFTVSAIHPTGMIGVISDGNNLSFPANWLNHHLEKIESKAKSIPLEQTEVTTRKRPAKGCGSGYLMVRSANVKRNEAKGKSPDCYYCYCYSYTNQYGKEIKSSLSVPRAKIAQVKKMVENKEHYVKIAKFLGKNLPLSY